MKLIKSFQFPKNYGQFTNLVKNILKQNIPRGCKTNDGKRKQGTTRRVH